MKIKLKTKEQLIEEFGFEKSIPGTSSFYNNLNYEWVITSIEERFLGKEIEVKKIEKETIVHPTLRKNYTHYSIVETHDFRLYWHELWFEHEEFIDEREFRI